MSTVLAAPSLALRSTGRWRTAAWMAAGAVACGVALFAAAGSMPQHSVAALGVAAALAAVLLLILRRPEWGAFLCLLVVYWNASDIIHDRLHFAWTLRSLLIWSWLAWLLHRWLLHRERPLRWPLWLPLLGLAGAQALSSVFAAYPWVAAANLFELLKDIALFYLIINLLPRPRDWQHGIWALLAAGSLMSLPVLFQGLTGSHFSFWGLAPQKLAGIYGGRMGYRASGSLGDPNFFAMALSALLPLAAAEGYRARSWAVRLFSWSSLAMICGAVILTYSRASFLGLLFVGLVFLYHFRRQPQAWGMAAAGLLGLMLIAPANYWQRMLSLHQVTGAVSVYNLQDPSLAARRNELAVGWAMARRHPLLGVGPGNYYMEFLRYQARAGLISQSRRHQVHNLFMEMLAETGILGLSAFLFFIVRLFGNMRASLRRLQAIGAGHFAALLWGTSASIATYLFLSLFLHDAYFRHFFVLLTLAGLAAQLVLEPPAPIAAAPAPAPAPVAAFQS